MNSITIIFSGALVLLTGFLAHYTRQLVNEQRISRQPNVVVSVEPDKRHSNIINFVIQNIGRDVAYDIDIQVIKDLKGSSDNSFKKLEDASFLKQEYMNPDYRVTSLIGVYHEIIDKQSAFKVSFKDKYGKEFKNKFSYDLSCLSGARKTTSSESEIAQSLIKISDNVNHLVSGFKHLQVDTYDSEDRRKDEQEKREIFKEMLSKNKKEAA